MREILVAIAFLALGCGEKARPRFRHDPTDSGPDDPVDSGGSRDASPIDAAPDAALDAGARLVHSTYERDFGVTTPICPKTQGPIWGDLVWEASVPEQATIAFFARVADSADGLSHAHRTRLGVAPPDLPPLYVNDILPEENRGSRFLRLQADLTWLSAGPPAALTATQLDWVCVDQ